MKRLARYSRILAPLLALFVSVIPLVVAHADPPPPGESNPPTVYDGPWTGAENPFAYNYTHGSEVIATVSHNITLPSDIVAGYRIVVLLSLYDNTSEDEITYSWPVDWVEADHFIGSGNITYALGSKVAVGDESDTVVTIISSVARKSSYMAFLMPVASLQNIPPLTIQTSYYLYMTSDAPQSPDTHFGGVHLGYQPAGEGKTFLTFSWFGFIGTTTLITPPSGYTDEVFEGSGEGGICLSSTSFNATGPGYYDVAAGAYSLSDSVMFLAGTIVFSWPPSVDTYPITDITETSATLTGQVVNAAGEPPANCGFIYRPVAGGDWIYTANVTGKVTGDIFSIPISGLTDNTSYDVIAKFYTVLQPEYGFSGEDIQFTTLVPYVAPTGTVVTLPASNVAATSATLNGNLTDLAGSPTYNVFFEYGLTVAYGSTTPLQSVNATGLFGANIAGLVANAPYHFRAVAANATDILYGADLTFSTGETGGLLQFGGGNARVFKNYLADNDTLVTAEIVNTYTPYYPNQSPKEYFSIQLIDTDNTTILAATPQQDWGDKPIGIYINPTQSARLTNGANYYVRIQGNFAANVTAQYQLQHLPWNNDWKGSDLTKLDDWSVYVAMNMQTFYSGGGYVTVLTDRKLAITDAVGGYFTAGIAGIGQVRPNLFTTSQQTPAFTAGISALPADNTTAYTAYVGSTIANDANDLGVPFGMTGRDMLAAGLALAMLGVIMTGTAAMGGFGALGLFLISIPILWLGTYFKIVGVQYIIVLTIIFGFLFVRQFWIKTT